jgi:nitrite reductase/ring-hydroxylating ferredoxin subunit
MDIQINNWCAVALSNEVVIGKPKGVFVDNESIVLFRDQDGVVRALENRCPHRRAPLSLGAVRAEGWLQCGYHGWSFEGATGQCKAIPNLRVDEKIPPTYGVFAYRAIEQHGLIYVAADEPARRSPDAWHRPQGKSFGGRRMIGLSPDDYVTALMDGPHLLLQCAGIRIAETMIADPCLRDGWLVMERAAFWLGQSSFDGFVREYSLIFRLAVRPHATESAMSFVRPDGAEVAAAHLAVTPSARGVTAILWRSFALGAPGVRPTLLRAATALGRPPIAPRRNIDMAAVADLLVGPSEHWPREQRGNFYGDALNKERVAL